MKELDEHFLGIVDYWKRQDREFYDYNDYIHVCPKLYRSLQTLANTKTAWNVKYSIRAVIEVYL